MGKVKGEPSRLLAYIQNKGDEGPVLDSEGEFAKEIEVMGWSDIHDMDMPNSVALGAGGGLRVFEGWIDKVSDEDVHFIGEWRMLSHWEMCRVRFGMTAFGESA